MSCSGNPTTYTSGTPADVTDLRKQLITMISKGLTTGANSYSGQIAAGTNPLMLGSANLLYNLMGYGNYPQSGTTGTGVTGTGTTGIGTVNAGNAGTGSNLPYGSSSQTNQDVENETRNAAYTYGQPAGGNRGGKTGKKFV